MSPKSLWVRVRPLISACVLLGAVFVGLHLWSGADPAGDPSPPAPPEVVLRRLGAPDVAPPRPTPRPPVSPTITAPPPTPTPRMEVILQSLPLVPVELTPTPTATPQ